MDDNIARAYTVFSDGNSVERALPSLQGGDAFDGSGSIRSCVEDMLVWSKTLIEASKIPVLSGSSEKLDRRNLLKAMRSIQEPQIPIDLDPSQSYALGLYTFCLPTKEINTVTNALEVMQSYVLGADSTPEATIGPTGDLGSSTSVYWTYPDTESAVIVMTTSNSVDGDPSSIVAQVVIQALFSLKPSIDFVNLAEHATKAAKSKWQNTVHTWESERQDGTDPKDLNTYVGLYLSTDLRMTLHVSKVAGHFPHSPPGMEICINGMSEQSLRLYHYHYDTWSFLPKSRDDCLAKGLAIYVSSWKAFNFEFDRFATDRFRGILWSMDIDPRAGPQVFSRIGP